ncbi:MAG: hypothetical protein ACLPLR_20160 [Terriglobales bacterium]
MPRFSVLILVVLLPVTSLTLACGSSSTSNRQLQSITINEVVNGQQVQFIATGTFSAPPTTVSPLPVSWSLDLPPRQYTLTTQPYTFLQCESAGPYFLPIVAVAPIDPNAPTSGSMYPVSNMIMQSAQITCP